MGIVLFILKTSKPPFKEAKASNPHYKCFIHNKFKYWKSYLKNRQKGFFSGSFKNLISKLFHLDKNKRIDIKDIK